METQGTEYATFIENELKSEYDRRDSVNSRAATAVTSATGLVTVTLAVVAVLKGKEFTLHGGALIALFVGLFAFLASAVLAVLAGLNWRFDVTSIPTLHGMRSEHWTDTETTARNIVAYCNVETISTLREGTNMKAGFLVAASFAQVVAIMALATSALIVVA
jgi:hypothetical protein